MPVIRRKCWGKFVLVLTVNMVLIFAGWVGFAAQSAQDISKITFYPDSATWEVTVPNEGASLRITGPGSIYFEKFFKNDSTPTFKLKDNFGTHFPDGTCSYELKILPQMNDETQKLFAANRQGIDKGEGIRIELDEHNEEVYTQTGTFYIEGGIITAASATAKQSQVDRDVLDGMAEDHLIYDDLIVTGSECLGFDCADGESFGFDTLILKEHNLRIYFNDTSYTASYPTNSWRITINDSTNGGASFFAIDDVDDGTRPFAVEAGAPSYSLYVEDYGRVGLGTNTPVVEMHIKDSDTPTVRLEQDSSGGWTAQTWDVAGNESNFFIRDATNGSKLPFRIQPSTPSSTLCLKSDGNVGIGTWSPAYSLEIERTSENAAVVAERTDGATTYVNATANYGNFGTVNDKPLRLVVNSSWRMRLNSDDSLEMSNNATCTAGGVWTSVSSREAKTDIRKLTVAEASQALESLDPVRFYYKAEKEEEYLGFIAEEVPELVATRDKKHMVDMDVIAVLTKVVQEQRKTIKNQENEISGLNERLDNIERLLSVKKDKQIVQN